jgi:hypothetical protein
VDLLLPGPQPPLSHFGVTLLRHVVVTGLRYALYHLDLPLPDKAPTRIEHLRLSLDPITLHRQLDGTPEGRAVLGALLEPRGAMGAGERPPAGAVFFHRQRLRWARLRRPTGLQAPPKGDLPALECHFREQLSRALPGLGDALLDEILTALRRRRQRGRGKVLPNCVGPQAAAWLRGRRARLEQLGSPDPFTTSWAEKQPDLDRSAIASPGRRDGGRGRFREVYRHVLDGLRPVLVALGGGAHEQGVVGHPDDLFFLPFELLGDLTGEEKPPWLDAALLRNRAEYFGLLRQAEPAAVSAWAAAPLHPLS